MQDQRVSSILNEIDQCILRFQAHAEELRKLLAEDDVWSEEEEAQYRWRHSS